MAKSETQKQRIEEKRKKLRDSLWPNLDESQIWLRENSKGWLTIPRAMPLVLRIMDSLATKGKPISATYLDLWCRNYDNAFVTVNNPREMAFFSGFTGERAESTWRTRIYSLKELDFIDVKEGVNPIGYILIYNPFKTIKKHYDRGNIYESYYNALIQRMIEVGAEDI